MSLLRVSLFLALTLGTAGLRAEVPTIPAFPLEPNDLELTRLASPSTPFDKVGRKFAVIGTEGGTFEAWAYPLKLFRNCELSFLIGSSTEPIRARDIVRQISVTPEETVRGFTYQSFTVKAIFVTAVDEAGAFIFLDVNSTEPLTIVCSFLPVLQPMWPAGIGGQSARWLDDLKAYQISEPTRSNTAYIGSPAAAGISYTPAHMLSDVPNQFRIDLTNPAALRGRYIPVIMAGGRGPRDSVRALYRRLSEDPARHYAVAVAHFRSLRQSTMRLQTPHRQITLAYEWAKVAYDNLIVDNPDLGRGLVAGLGPSGTGGRPGFGWFFGGDAYINSFSLNSMGALATVREALAFTRKWQREDGKMAHELSQAAGYINWFKDYPYGYIHGDTSPFYIVALDDYLRASGDVDFIRASWPSARRAYEWSLATDGDGDGLMDNKKAGLGALEYGALTDVQSDIYTSAVWVRATQAMERIARAAGEEAEARRAAGHAARALETFRSKFWDETHRQYSYAFNARGEHVTIVSPWSSVGLMWELGDPARSVLTMEKLNSAELATDWGTRSIAISSEYFEPLNYNYGAVWPFLTSWVGTAQYRHHLPFQGYTSLMASVNHTFDNALGYVTEVFSGYQNIWPQEAVAHQGFCSAGVVLPLVRGMLGLEPDVPGRRITFAPHFPPDWQEVTVENIPFGQGSARLVYARQRDTIRLSASGTLPPGTVMHFAPAVGIGSRILSVSVNGSAVSFRERPGAQTVQPLIEWPFEGPTECVVVIDAAPEIVPPDPPARTGETNSGIKLIATTREGDGFRVVLEGLAGRTYALRITRADKVASVTGGDLSGDTLQIRFPEGPVGEFTRRELRVRQK